MRPTEYREVILARGHKNVSATHKTTLEITKEPRLSKKGDCIVAVEADKAIDDLSSQFKRNLRKDNAKLTILVEAGGVAETVHASGSSRLVLCHLTDMVVRTSDHICNRTLAIEADKSANELSRKLVKELRNPEQRVKITLVVKT